MAVASRGEAATVADQQAVALTLDRRIAEMRALLIEMRAADTAGALRALREAYPEVPLAERVSALAGWRH